MTIKCEIDDITSLDNIKELIKNKKAHIEYYFLKHCNHQGHSLIKEIKDDFKYKIFSAILAQQNSVYFYIKNIKKSNLREKYPFINIKQNHEISKNVHEFCCGVYSETFNDYIKQLTDLGFMVDIQSNLNVNWHNVEDNFHRGGFSYSLNPFKDDWDVFYIKISFPKEFLNINYNA